MKSQNSGDIIEIHGKKFQPFISKQTIQTRIEAMATEINAEYAGQELVLLCVMNGSMIFTSDLCRALKVPAELAFIRVKSYSGTESSGKIELKYEPENNLKNKHVLLIEDIIDTGHTIDVLMQILENKGAASIRICSLLSKPGKNKSKQKLDFIGFEIGNQFVVGYGLDYDELGRNLPEIYSEYSE